MWAKYIERTVGAVFYDLHAEVSEISYVYYLNTIRAIARHKNIAAARKPNRPVREPISVVAGAND
jgi:hypothetical protein